MEEKTLFLATLVFPVMGSKVMLATKVKKIGAGLLNGWGGGIEIGESVRACAVREFFEETGGAEISEDDLQKVGIVHFKNNKSDGTYFVCTVHVFTISKWFGDIVSTEEMENPQWYEVDNIPFDRLMLADSHWLPRMLSGEKGIASAQYGPYQESLIGDVVFQSTDLLEEE
ncbi:MAG: NUDIX domain-containing protein [Minisyncoccota bacterium]